MLLQNEFAVDTNIDDTWNLLTNLERVATCLPGAAIQDREGEEYLGTVKVKVGPIGANFAGRAHFAEKDDTTKKATISAAGKDQKGQAAANAQIHARLEQESPTRTRVVIDTDLDISGRMAQFGRGTIADVSNRLMGQFSDNLSREILGNTASQPAAPQDANTVAPQTPPTTAATPAAAAPASADLDAMALVLPMIKERYGQALAGGLIGVVLSWLLWGRKVT